MVYTVDREYRLVQTKEINNFIWISVLFDEYKSKDIGLLINSVFRAVISKTVIKGKGRQ